MKLMMLGAASILLAVLVVGLQSGSNPVPAKAGIQSGVGAGDQATANIFAPGRVEGASREIELRPGLAGRVTTLKVKVGDSVTNGDLLLQVDPSQHLASVHLAEAQLRAAEGEMARLLGGSHEEERRHAVAIHEAKLAQLGQAKRTFERFSQLSAGGAVARQETELRQSELHVLEAEALAAETRVRLLNAAPRPDELDIASAHIEAAKAQLEMARCRLADTELRAPISGQVLSVDVRAGEIVGPASPQPAITMADTSRLRIRAFVDEYDAIRVHAGLPATTTVDGLAGRQFRGRVAELSPIMKRKQLRTNEPAERLDTDTREVVIALDEKSGLVVGMRVDVVIGPRYDPIGGIE